MKALLVIDVQEAMFTFDGGVFEGEMVVSCIRGLIDRAHDAHVPVIYIQHTEDEGPFMEGLDSWQIRSSIKPTEIDIVIQKNYPDSFMKTTLEENLKKMKVDELIVCGMQTEYCVDTSLRRAFSLGYKTTIVKEGHTTFNTKVLDAKTIREHHVSIWKGSFGKLVGARDIIF